MLCRASHWLTQASCQPQNLKHNLSKLPSILGPRSTGAHAWLQEASSSWKQEANEGGISGMVHISKWMSSIWMCFRHGCWKYFRRAFWFLSLWYCLVQWQDRALDLPAWQPQVSFFILSCNSSPSECRMLVLSHWLFSCLFLFISSLSNLQKGQNGKRDHTLWPLIGSSESARAPHLRYCCDSSETWQQTGRIQSNQSVVNLKHLTYTTAWKKDLVKKSSNYCMVSEQQKEQEACSESGDLVQIYSTWL